MSAKLADSAENGPEEKAKPLLCYCLLFSRSLPSLEFQYQSSNVESHLDLHFQGAHRVAPHRTGRRNYTDLGPGLLSEGCTSKGLRRRRKPGHPHPTPAQRPQVGGANYPKATLLAKFLLFFFSREMSNTEV